MAVSINSMKSMASDGGGGNGGAVSVHTSCNEEEEEEIEIPEGKVEQVCRQFLVHEDEGLAYRMQVDEIQDHLQQNKNKSRLVRSDLLQAQTLQQLELHEQQRQQAHQQQAKDEQLAKEMQLRLIEDEQRQTAEKERIAQEDERLAQRLAEKERQKAVRRKQAREQAQIEKIKRDRLQFYRDNQLEITDSINDDLNELDLSDFCAKPPAGQLSGEELNQFLADQDEELARFLQMYENQRKAALVKDNSQTLLEHQDHEIARILFEEEKAKARRMKEKKRLAKQLLKQQQQQTNSFAMGSSSAYDPNGEQIYANHTQIVEHRRESYYEEPSILHHYRPQYSPDDGESPSSHYESCVEPFHSDRSVTAEIHHHHHHQVTHAYLHEADSQSTGSSSQVIHSTNDRLNRDFEIFEPNSGGGGGESVQNFVSQPMLAANFHNIAMDIDPTYNRKLKEQNHSLRSNRQSIEPGKEEESEQTDVKQQIKDLSGHAGAHAGTHAGTLASNESPDFSGIHFAQLARVSPCVSTGNGQQSTSTPPPPLPPSLPPPSSSLPLISTTLPHQVAANVDEYIQFAMQQRQNGGYIATSSSSSSSGYPLPVQGQRRQGSTSGSGHKKSKSKDKCKYQ